MVRERMIILAALGLAIAFFAGAALGQEEEAVEPPATPEAAQETPKESTPEVPAEKAAETPAEGAPKAPAETPAEGAPKAPVVTPPEVTPEGPGEGEAELVPTGPAKKPTLATLWQDLIHYIEVAQADAARSTAQAIIASKPTPSDVYMLSVSMPQSMTVLAKAANWPEMQDAVNGLRRLVEAGYEADRADPERIRRSIEELEKGLEGYALARERLKIHGEYAVPQLLMKLMDPGTSSSLKSRVVTVLPAIGKDAVRPLSVALQTSDATLQEILARALGQIEYPHAAPRLKELMERKDTLDRVRKVAEAALVACAGTGAKDMSAASLFYQQAEKYYYRAESLLPDIRSRTANVWFWREGAGLVVVPVPQEVFCDLYAMRMARLALEHDPNFYPAVSLWISADLDRQAKLPPGQVDPLRGMEQPPASFYSLASSPRYLKDVVERALDDFNTPVAMGAIKALVRTAGTRSMVELTGSGARPLVEAMSYPDREVRFRAAVSLAGSLPKEPFEGSPMVMAALTTALRQEGGKVAILVAADLAQRNKLKSQLRDIGFTVVDASDVAHAIAAANKLSGVDIAVVGSRPSPGPVIEAVRSRLVYARMPFVVALKSQATRQLAESDGKILLVDPDPNPEEMKAAVSKAVILSVGRALSPEESISWSVTAAETIRNLGLTGNKAFDLSLTHNALIESLGDNREQVQIAAAKALAVMGEPKTQRAVANLAINAAAREDVRIAAFGALTESVRRFGNQLLGEHVKAIIDVVSGKASMPLREAAAEAMGALDLPSHEVIPLIKAVPGP